MSQNIRTISAEDLKAKLDQGDARFKLVNTLGDWEFKAKHIPGSLHLPTVKAALEALKPEDEIVVYCSNPACLASQVMYRELVQHGFRNVRRFEGGLMGWEDAGYPPEGDWVT